MRLLFLLTALLFALQASATDVRGRIEGQSRYSHRPFPVKGVRVTLWASEGGRWTRRASAITSYEGMYYFRGIRPGRYWIQVEGRNFSVQVRNVRLQDIRRILVTR